MIFNKMLRAFAIGALLLTICVACLMSRLPRSAIPLRPPNRKAAPALPAPGTYTIDPVHTFAYFGAWHHVVGLVRGRFEKVEGTLTVSQDPAACSVYITIDASSISTQNSERDEDLRGPDFFDVKKFPAVTYRGRGVRPASGGSWGVGRISHHPRRYKVASLTFTFKGVFSDTPPGKPVRAAFHALAATKRGDFGMTRDNLVELGVPPAPGSDVAIEIDIEAYATNPKQ